MGSLLKGFKVGNIGEDFARILEAKSFFFTLFYPLFSVTLEKIPYPIYDFFRYLSPCFHLPFSPFLPNSSLFFLKYSIILPLPYTLFLPLFDTLFLAFSFNQSSTLFLLFPSTFPFFTLSSTFIFPLPYIPQHIPLLTPPFPFM